MAPHSSLLPGKSHGRGSLVGCSPRGHEESDIYWATSLSLFTFMHWRRKWQPTPVFLPGESQGRGAWWATDYGVTHSRTRLRRLGSSSSDDQIKVLGMLDSVFPYGSVGKEFACSSGDLGSIPEFRRSPGGGNGNPLQYSCLKNPMDRGAWWVHDVAESDRMERLSTEWLENTWKFWKCVCSHWRFKSCSAWD